MMTAEQRAAFLEARAQGLGGSDCASLLQPDIEVKYGCARRLGLQKARVEPDFPREESGPMRLGQILEPVLCEDFARLTGRTIREVGRQTNADHPELGGHVDRMQDDAVKGEGVVEAKALGTRIFYQVKREGIITDYELQLAFYLAVTGARYGSFVVGNRDNLAIIHWDVERNEQLCEAIVRRGVEFWANVGNLDKLAPKLEPDDNRCQRCEYSLRCHGAALAPSDPADPIPVVDDLMPLAQEYIERKAELDRADEALAETKEIIATVLGERQAAYVHVGEKLRPVYYRPQDGKPLYAEAVKNMSVAYNHMRDALIRIEGIVKSGDFSPESGRRLTQLAGGAELISPPSNFIRKGKPSRPLLLQFLSPKAKEEE